MLVLIRQAKVIDTQSEFHNKVVDILVEDGVIKSIGASVAKKADKVIEAKGLHVSAGWVDVFADYCEPGYEQKETIASGLNAAATGGYTHTFIVPNTHPSISTKSVVEFVLQKSKGYPTTLHPLGSVSQHAEGKVLAEMIDMRHSGAVAFTDGWHPVQHAGLMQKALEYVKAFEGTVIQLPNDATLSAGGLMNEGETSTRLGMAGIPSMAETLMVHRDIELLRYTKSRLHITGISAAASVELIRQAKAEGLQVTCSVTPYHLALTEDALSTYDSLYKVSPPLRTEADRLALIAGIKDGTIDCIASHHRPQEWDAKAKEFEYAANGMNLQETAFPVLWHALSKHISVNRLVDLLSTNPRKIFGLGKPAINKGAAAQLTIFSTTEADTVGHLQSTSANNPFIGQTLKGKVFGIINNGQSSFI